jgi:hypothetical protein
VSKLTTTYSPVEWLKVVFRIAMSALHPVLGHEERYFVDAPTPRVIGRERPGFSPTMRSVLYFKKLVRSCPC